MKSLSLLAAGLLATAALIAQPAYAGNPHFGYRSLQYRVTITNLTSGEIFTPLVVTTHTRSVHLFTLGSPASDPLRIVAEDGNPMPLVGLLQSTSGVHDIKVAPGATKPDKFTKPGATRSFTLNARFGDHVSIAAMLVPTNDTFVALNSVPGPVYQRSVTYYARAYDSGTEKNDELCTHVAGPSVGECAGVTTDTDQGHARNGDGFVHVAYGIQGNGDLLPSMHDWRNPVARIVITRSFGGNRFHGSR